MRNKILVTLFLMLFLNGCSLFKEEIDTSDRVIEQPHEHCYEYTSNNDGTHTKACPIKESVTEAITAYTERGTEYTYNQITNYIPCNEEPVIEECSYDKRVCSLCKFNKPEILVDYDLGYKMSDQLSFEFADGYILPSSYNRTPEYYSGYFYNYFRTDRNSQSKVWAMDYKQGVPGFIVTTEEYDKNHTYYLMHDGNKVLNDYPYEIRELYASHYVAGGEKNKTIDKWLICMPTNVLWSKATTDSLGTKDSAIKISRAISQEEVINISLYEYYNQEEEDRGDCLKFGSENFNAFLVPLEAFMTNHDIYNLVVDFMLSKVDVVTEDISVNAPLQTQEEIKSTIKGALNVDSTLFDESVGYWNYVILANGEEWVVYATSEVDVQTLVYENMQTNVQNEITYATVKFDDFRNNSDNHTAFIDMVNP